MFADKPKILMLVEGAKMEIKLMEHLLSVYGISQSHQIVSYNTSIYDLYAHMFVDTDPDDVDLLQLLKERETDPAKKKLFDDRYSDILLVFDLDPQDSRFSVEKITQMVSYFIESSDMGKLYLNYPMVEAFYHMSSIPDPAYFSYVASLEELQAHKYKERVVAESRNHRLSKFAVDRNECNRLSLVGSEMCIRDRCNTVIEQNIEKAWWILNHAGRGKTEQLLPEAADVLSAQMRELASVHCVFVLCTCVFYIPDYNPRLLHNGSSL